MKVTCDYCGGSARLIDSRYIYKKPCGMIWYCAKCRAWVKADRRTNEPAGRLANGELREARRVLHHVLERLWRYEHFFTKAQATELVAARTGITDFRIADLNLEQCETAIIMARQIYREAKANDKTQP